MGGFEDRKGKGKLFDYIIFSKPKNILRWLIVIVVKIDIAIEVNF